MSLSTKRMVFVAVMAALMGIGGYKFVPGTMHERRLTGFIGILSGFVVGRMVAPMVFPDTTPAVAPSDAVV